MRTLNVIAVLLQCVFLTGCLFPVPAGYARSGAPRDKRDFSVIKRGETTLTEVTNRFGEMDFYYPDLRTGYYALDTLHQRTLWLALVVPIGTRRVGDQFTEARFIHFDQNSCVERMDVSRVKTADLRTHMITWSGESK